MTWRFWIDVGGTFTDCIGINPQGSALTHKLLSSGSYKLDITRVDGNSVSIHTSLKFCEGFFKGYSCGLTHAVVESFDPVNQILTLNQSYPNRNRIELFSPETSPMCAMRYLMGLTLDKPVGDVSLRLGTTIGTNALLELKGASVGFVTTAGFEDILLIGDQTRKDLFALDVENWSPIFSQCLGVCERIDASGAVLEAVDQEDIRQKLEALYNEGLRSLAICLVNSHRNDEHERIVGELAKSIGFDEISLSSRVAKIPKLVPRSQTTLLDAYLNPVLKNYLSSLRSFLPLADIQLMASSGQLMAPSDFSGKDSVLSGPAGGVLGVSSQYSEKSRPLIGFDMGGTSTDVCRFDGEFHRKHEFTLVDKEKNVGMAIVAPVLDVETVAAGGGSICWYDGYRLRVGPQSAGSQPGPACYGNGGPITVTDLNAFLGYLPTDALPFDLDLDAVSVGLDEIRTVIEVADKKSLTKEALALDFLRIAVENMGEPIERLSLRKGHDLRAHSLVSFGGAASQIVCRVAESLGVGEVLVHRFSSIFSAYGIGLAKRGAIANIDFCYELTGDALEQLMNAAELEKKKLRSRMQAGEVEIDSESFNFTLYVNARFVGQDSTLPIRVTSLDLNAVKSAFHQSHKKIFGFTFQNRSIELRSFRLELSIDQEPFKIKEQGEQSESAVQRIYDDGKWISVPCLSWGDLRKSPKKGPLIIKGFDTVVYVMAGWTVVFSEHHLRLSHESGSKRTELSNPDHPYQLAIWTNKMSAIADMMGAQLELTSISVNIKERRDFSCAIFSAEGDLLVNAPHIPVHLGAMSDTVRCLIRSGKPLSPGLTYACNHPRLGGSHLPDVSLISPVFVKGHAKPILFVANRAHHSELGGITPGSMPPFSKELSEEGVIIPFTQVMENGEIGLNEIEALLRAPPFPSRNVSDNLSDLRAQIAANVLGCRNLVGFLETIDFETIGGFVQRHLHMGKDMTQNVLKKIGESERVFSDTMDDGYQISVRISIEENGGLFDATVDFSGSYGCPVPGNLNAGSAIIKSALLYVLRLLAEDDALPLNDGALSQVQLHIPEGSFSNPFIGDSEHLPAVVGGNVETSQRIVDVLLGAFGRAAASQGTMNNLIVGNDQGLGFYETLGGGAGATDKKEGAHGVQVHMTNTKITDIEILEERYPVLVREFSIRRASGGRGKFSGGDGLCRHFEFLEPLTVSLLTERRSKPPFGLNGGAPGLCGRNLYRMRGEKDWQELEGKVLLNVQSGDELKILTPGGGGFGG